MARQTLLEQSDSFVQCGKGLQLHRASLRYESEELEVELGTYANVIDNYIYARPTDSIHQTIAGSFPLYQFTQTNAFFKGVDLDVIWHLTKHLQFDPKTTLVFANDLTNHDYLVLIPPERFQNTLEYRWKKIGKLKNVFVSAGSMSVLRQTRVPPNSDFVPPPAGYSLLLYRHRLFRPFR